MRHQLIRNPSGPECEPMSLLVRRGCPRDRFEGRGARSLIVASRVIFGCWLMLGSIPATFAESGETVALSARTPAQTRRAHALALYGAGRRHFHREAYAAALERYQRAWLYHPHATGVLWEIYQLADHLGRSGVARRYGVLACEREPRFPALSYDLAVQLVDDGQPRRARTILAKAWEAHQAADLIRVALAFESIRTHLVLEEKMTDVAPLRIVLDAWQTPQDFQTTAAELDVVTGGASLTWQICGRVALDSGFLAEAKEAWDAWDAAEGPHPITVFRRAQLAEAQGDWQTAAQALAKYLTTKNRAAGTAPYDMLRRVVEHRFPENPEKATVVALRQWARLARIDPANDVLAAYAASQYLRQDNAAEALVLLEPLAAGPLDEGVVSLLMTAYAAREDYDALATLLGRLLQETQTLPVEHPALQPLRRVGPPQAAFVQVLEARRRHPRHPLLPQEALAGAIVLLTSNASQAERLAAAGLTSTDADVDPAYGTIWAVACMDAQKYAWALPHLRSWAARLTPQDGNWVDAVGLLAAAVAEEEGTDAALTLVQSAIRSTEDTADRALLQLKRCVLLQMRANEVPHAAEANVAEANVAAELNELIDAVADEADLEPLRFAAMSELAAWLDGGRESSIRAPKYSCTGWHWRPKTQWPVISWLTYGRNILGGWIGLSSWQRPRSGRNLETVRIWTRWAGSTSDRNAGRKR